MSAKWGGRCYDGRPGPGLQPVLVHRASPRRRAALDAYTRSATPTPGGPATGSRIPTGAWALMTSISS
jgi:hypothetical protein